MTRPPCDNAPLHACVRTHTPAPWRAEPWTCHAATTILVDDASTVTGKRVIAEFESVDEARLGASAPELLERLEELLEYSSALKGSAIYRRVQDAITTATGAA